MIEYINGKRNDHMPWLECREHGAPTRWDISSFCQHVRYLVETLIAFGNVYMYIK